MTDDGRSEGEDTRSDPSDAESGPGDAESDLGNADGRLERDDAGHDGEGYTHRPLTAFEVNPEKPGERWELSPQLGIENYNVNVAVLERGERLSQNAYHYHPNQHEFYYVVGGRLRVETEGGSFDLGTDEVVRFEEGVPHLLHNPYDESCKVVAVGDPPEGRRPVIRVQGYEELCRERYGESPPNPE